MKKFTWLWMLMVSMTMLLIGWLMPLPSMAYTLSETDIQTNTKDTDQNNDRLIRIGILHNSKKADFAHFSATTGIRLVVEWNQGETSLTEYPAARSLSVLKDVYHGIVKQTCQIKTQNNRQTENWHIAVNGTYPTFSEAQAAVATYKSKGLHTFVAYDGSFKTYTGWYDVFEATDYYRDILTQQYPDLSFSSVKPSEKGILVLDQEKLPYLLLEKDGMRLSMRPKDNGLIKMNEDAKKIYRGTLSVYRTTAGAFTVHNVVPVQHYLYGVVPAEIGGNSPLESVKAQSVAARNYAYNNLHKHAQEGFDLCDTVECQVYGGKTAEVANSNRAVDETFNKFLMYNGKYAQVFYFSSTGGEKTEDVENVWGSKIPYLKSVDSLYESGKTYHATWKMSFKLDELKKMLADRKTDLGDIRAVEVTKRSPAGRVTELKVIGSKGEKLYLRESARTIFRLSSQFYAIQSDADVVVKEKSGDRQTILAGRKVLSAKGLSDLDTGAGKIRVLSSKTFVEIQPRPQNFSFSGKGWGHAVGLSQDAAIGMAKNGYTYDQILTHFFPGTQVQATP